MSYHLHSSDVYGTIVIMFEPNTTSVHSIVRVLNFVFCIPLMVDAVAEDGFHPQIRGILLRCVYIIFF